MDKVAIITPVYNSEKYLSEMIDSVLQQSFKNFDLILIDDQSTDGSSEICKKYSQNYKNIHYVEMDNNSGPGLTRNKGLEFVKEKLFCNFFTFVDSDDVLGKTYLERMVKAIKKTKTNIVISKTTKEDFRESNDTETISSNELFKFRKKYRNFPGNGVGAKLFRVNLIDTFIFPQERHEDLFIIPKIILCEKQITLLDCSLYFYRYRPESESHHESFHLSMLDRLCALKQNLEYVVKNNIDAKYHFYNEYFEYLNYLILITKKDKKTNKKLLAEKKEELKIHKDSLISDIGKANYYRYLFTEKSLIFKILSRCC